MSDQPARTETVTPLEIAERLNRSLTETITTGVSITQEYPLAVQLDLVAWSTLIDAAAYAAGYLAAQSPTVELQVREWSPAVTAASERLDQERERELRSAVETLSVGVDQLGHDLADSSTPIPEDIRSALARLEELV